MTKEEMEDMGIETKETDKEIWVNRILEKGIPAITLDAMREATALDTELAQVLEHKRQAKKSPAMSKGPFGKIIGRFFRSSCVFIEFFKSVRRRHFGLRLLSFGGMRNWLSAAACKHRGVLSASCLFLSSVIGRDPPLVT